MRGMTPHGSNPALDLSKLPGYLSVASNGELATLAQQARNPAIISAVDAEMKKRQGGAGQPPAPIGQSDAPVPAAGLSVGGFRPQLQSAGPEAAAGPPALLPRPVLPRGGMPMGGWPSGPDMMTPEAPSYPTADAPTPGPDVPGTWTGPNGVQFGEPRRSPAASTDRDNTIAPDSRGGWIPPWQRTPVDQSTNAALQAGAAAADDATGAPADDIQTQVMQRLMGKPGDQSRDVGLAILRAGLGMMASSSPNALQAIGEGGAEGLDYYTKTRQQEAENQTRAAGIQGQVNQQTETGRSNRATEGISRGNLDVAKQHAVIAGNQLALTQRMYEEGRATKEQVDQANIRQSEASAAYTAALAGTVGQQYVNGSDGTLYQVRGGQAQPVNGPDGQPIIGATKVSGSGSGATAQMKNIQDMMANLGIDYPTAYQLIRTGPSMAPSVRRAKAVQLAQQAAAANATTFAMPPAELAAETARMADQFEALLAAGAPTEAPTAAPVGTGAAPNAGAAAAPKYAPGSTIYIQGKPYTVDPNGTSVTPQ